MCAHRLLRLQGQFLVAFHRGKSSSAASQDDFLQRSSMPTMHFQKSLPRLPIPDLKKTCTRYLRAQEPLLSADEMAKLERIVKNFEIEGAQVQKELVHVDSMNKHTSYISAPWFDMYLSNRTPLPINMNPGIVLTRDPKLEYNDQFVKATNFLISSLRFMKSLRAGILEPEVYHLNPKKSDTKLFKQVTGLLPSSISWYGAYLFKAFPLDMSQYKNLFNTSRIPKKGKDELYYDPSQEHVTIMCNGHFFRLKVLDSSGAIIDAPTLLSCLKYISSQSVSPPEHPVGILTSLERDAWADARKYLENIGNHDVLRDIDGSLFVICLDDDKIDESGQIKAYIDTVREFLHSDGCNRWFDKCLSVIINKSGDTGVNFEHSWGDGVAVLRYMTDVCNDSSNNPRCHPTTEAKSISNISDYVKALDFTLDEKAKSFISEARNYYNKWVDSLSIDASEYKKMGRDFTKKVKISPDCVMQLSFQLAQYKLEGKNVGTYESCSTSAFKHGRTETMRPCTIETDAICKALSQKTRPSKDELKSMLYKCSEVHSNLIKDAAMGQGFDRHLFALKNLYEKSGKSHEIFTHPSYAFINYNIISTSTLTSDLIKVGSFGPVVPNGYGIGYSVNKERMGCIISSYKGKANGADFLNAVNLSLEELYQILA